MIYDLKKLKFAAVNFFLCHYLEFQESQTLVKASEMWKTCVRITKIKY